MRYSLLASIQVALLSVDAKTLICLVGICIRMIVSRYTRLVVHVYEAGIFWSGTQTNIHSANISNYVVFRNLNFNWRLLMIVFFSRYLQFWIYTRYSLYKSAIYIDDNNAVNEKDWYIIQICRRLYIIIYVPMQTKTWVGVTMQLHCLIFLASFRFSVNLVLSLHVLYLIEADPLLTIWRTWKCHILITHSSVALQLSIVLMNLVISYW